MTRGVRNNNPGNIRYSEHSGWQGRVAYKDKKDKAFEEFVSESYGIRALMKLLKNYQNKYELRTVREIVGRYAPSNENDTPRYVRTVCKEMGVAPDDVLDVNEKYTLYLLVQAICWQECSVRISVCDLTEAFNML